MQDLSSTKVFEGFLDKKGAINKSWKKRWFVLYNGRRLAYFESEKSQVAIKEIDLSEVTAINIVPTKQEKSKQKQKKKRSQTKEKVSNTNGMDSDSDSDANMLKQQGSLSVANDDAFRRQSATKSGTSDRARSFELVTPKRTYLLSCGNDEKFREWVEHLERVIFGRRVFSGWLTKRGAYRKNWKKRWFVVFDTQEMRYYDNEASAVPRGLIKLHEVLLMCPGDEQQYTQPYTIQLMTPDRNWVVATDSVKERDSWFSTLEEVIHGAKRLITSHEGYLWRRKGNVVKSWKKRYFALSKGWLFYFEEEFYCNKFKSIAFFSEAFFHQAFQLYVKGSIPLNQTTIQKVDISESQQSNVTQTQTDTDNNNNSNNNNNVNNVNNTSSNDVDNDTDKPNDSPNDSNNQNNENMSKKHIFKITTDKKEFFFACDSEQELNKWFKAFHHIYADNYNYNSGGDTPTGSQSESMWTQNSGTQTNMSQTNVTKNGNVNANGNTKTNINDKKSSFEVTNDNNKIGNVAMAPFMKTSVDFGNFMGDDEKMNGNDSGNDNNLNNNGNDKLGQVDSNHIKKRSTFFDLIDPNHDGKWVDIEQEDVIEKQGQVTRKSLLEHEKLNHETTDSDNTNNNQNTNDNENNSDSKNET